MLSLKKKHFYYVSVSTERTFFCFLTPNVFIFLNINLPYKWLRNDSFKPLRITHQSILYPIIHSISVIPSAPISTQAIVVWASKRTNKSTTQRSHKQTHYGGETSAWNTHNNEFIYGQFKCRFFDEMIRFKMVRMCYDSMVNFRLIQKLELKTKTKTIFI